MGKSKAIIYGVLFLSSCLFANGDERAPFESAIMEQVMNGKIVSSDVVVVDPKVEFHNVIRAYFDRVSADAYIDLATDHPKYPTMFSEIKNGKTLTVDEAKNVFTYIFTIAIPYGPFVINVHPEGHQVITRAPDAVSESHIFNELTNYQDKIDFAHQNTRLIPWENGILVEDDVHVKVIDAGSQGQTIKQHIAKFFTRYVETFKKVLTGSYL